MLHYSAMHQTELIAANIKYNIGNKTYQKK